MDILGFDIKTLFTQTGTLVAYLLAFAVIFAESSLIFFLPGDSFIIAAALLASQDVINIWLLLGLMLVAAVIGNNLGYYLGKRYGRRLFSRDNSLLFDRKHIERSEAFYAKYGPITVVLARFVPMVRTVAPILAGVGNMNYGTFFFYNIAGAILWVVGLGLLGFYAGELIPNVDRYILPFIIAVVLLSVSPGLISLWKSRHKR